MFTRHLFAAAALMAATFSAQADVIPTTPDAASSVSAAGSNVEYFLVRGVEGLYMVSSRLIGEADAVDADLPAGADAGIADDTIVTSPILDAVTPGVDAPLAIDAPGVDADPLAEVPEPSSVALMLAGLIGAVGFTRARKQQG